MKKRQKTETRELTTYEADLQVYNELAWQAWRNAPPRVSAKQAAKDDAAVERDLHREAVRVHKSKLRDLAGQAPVLVYCTTCGKPRTGPRRDMAKFRTCCDVPAGAHKYCRQCAAVMTREAYFASKYASPKGWGTLATCQKCKHSNVID